MPLHHTHKLIGFICATHANIQRPDLWSVNHLAALILPLRKQPPDSDKRNQALTGYQLGSQRGMKGTADGLFSIFCLRLVLHHSCQDRRRSGIPLACRCLGVNVFRSAPDVFTCLNTVI